MRIARTKAELRSFELCHHGLVPTMGALHEGHCELIREAKRDQHEVVVSIFVNPTQFAAHEDLSRYPRPFQQDLELAEASGATVVFAPEVSEMYSSEPVSILVPGVTELYEGAFRPTHFAGVATIVAKLFNIVQPRCAYFGKKDLQQCAVIRKLVTDLDIPVNLKFCETIREIDGLAKSSRNIYLSDSERALAPKIYQLLSTSKDAVLRLQSIPEVERLAIQELTRAGFEVDYFSVIDENTFRPADSLTVNFAIVCAVKVGKTRLIDNVTFVKKV